MASGSEGAVGALAATVRSAGASAEILEGPHGSEILVLTHGGRILGASAGSSAGRSADNFFWTNPALLSVDSARRLIGSDAWCNTGGDRTWISPEADFFLPLYPDNGVYFQPRALDPGAYTSSAVSGSLVLENRLTLHSYRTGEDVSLLLSKTVTPIDAFDAGILPPARGVTGCGYSLRCRLAVLNEAPRTPVSLWNLLQLPHDGTMLMPTRGTTQPVVYFGSLAADDLSVGPGLVAWRMKAPGERKIGLPASAVTGRLGYVSGGRGDEACLVVRDFEVNAAGHYVDAPYHGGGGDGGRQGLPPCAVQACSVSGGALGDFNEFEYHAPAIGGSTGLSSLEETSRVRCYRGPAGIIREVVL